MKRILTLTTCALAGMLLYVAPALSDEVTNGAVSGKDECLLVSMNCSGNSDSVQERIARIQGEIAKGTDVYTPEELQQLNDKLDTANNLLNYLQNNERPTAGQSI